MPLDPLVIARLDGGRLVLHAEGLASHFLAVDPSSVGVGAYDSLAGRGNPDRIELGDVVAPSAARAAGVGRRLRGARRSMVAGGSAVRLVQTNTPRRLNSSASIARTACVAGRRLLEIDASRRSDDHHSR